MRLLNTATYQLQVFEGTEGIPEYAILSHTWGSNEIVLEDLEKAPLDQWQRQKRDAHYKVEGSCSKAARHGYTWIWIDTCCIDKRSSSELSEAINSMFRYYAEAKVCYVFLGDLPPDTTMSGNERWFSRGWTLQEMIAPRNIIIYDCTWTLVGDKLELSRELADITGVDAQILKQEQCSLQHPIDKNNTCNCPRVRMPISDILASTSTAKIMSWASQRHTKKEEDVAYSLMGLFDINMPLLYGEGSKAFLRLQAEILRKRKDHSILAWRKPDEATRLRETPSSLMPPLARSPAVFQHVDDIDVSSNTRLSALEDSRAHMSFVDGRLTVDMLLCPIRIINFTFGVPRTTLLAAMLDATKGSNTLCRPVIIIARVDGSIAGNERYRRYSENMYYISEEEPTTLRQMGRSTSLSLQVDLAKAKRTRVTFVGQDGPHQATKRQSMSSVHVKIDQKFSATDDSLYGINWRNCQENSMGSLPRSRVSNVPEDWIYVFQRSGTVSFRAKQDHYPPFWVTWVMCYNGYNTLAAQYIAVCKIWEWELLGRSDNSTAYVEPWSSRVASHDDTWNLQLKSDSARLSSSSSFSRDIEIRVSVDPTTFLERTVIKMRVEIQDVDGSSDEEMELGKIYME